MHLDTIFNRINTDEVIVFPPLFTDFEQDHQAVDIHTIKSFQTLEEATITNRSLIDVIKDDGVHIKPINCGGDKKLNQVREQWTDGANFFTIKPASIEILHKLIRIRLLFFMIIDFYKSSKNHK